MFCCRHIFFIMLKMEWLIIYLLYCCHLADSNVQLLSTVRFWNFLNWLHLYCCICNVSYFDVNKCMPNIRQCVSLLNVLNHAWLSGFFCYKKNVINGQKYFCSNSFWFTHNSDVHGKFCQRCHVKNLQETYYTISDKFFL